MRKRIAVLLGAITALTGIALLFAHRSNSAPDPMTHGKPLSHWLLAQYDLNERYGVAQVAIKNASTNALPFLIEQIEHYHRQYWKFQLAAVAASVLPSPAKKAIFTRLLRPEGFIQNCVEAFSTLGTNATPAIPHLVKLASQSTPPDTAEFALAALANIGKPSIPVLYGIITNRACQHRAEAIEGLCNIDGLDTAEALTVLRSTLSDPDPTVCDAATNAIRQISTIPAVNLHP